MGTGSCLHLVGKADIPTTCTISECDEVELSTASGPLTVTQQVETTVPKIERPLVPLVLEDTPAVLSIGRLCIELGYSFCWFNSLAPHLLTPSGKEIYFTVRNFVLP